jgi:hypothetical protein
VYVCVGAGEEGRERERERIIGRLVKEERKKL